jgi:hypothetical protein
VAMTSCSKRPEATSPTGRLLARCENPGGGFAADELVVVDPENQREVHRWKPASWRGIRGFAWAPNAGSVAILSNSSSWGKAPLELIAALSGHPVPHDTIYLAFLNIKTGTVTEYVIQSDVVSSYARLLDWSDRS